MVDHDAKKTKAELIRELKQLRKKLSRLEKSSAKTRAYKGELAAAAEQYRNLINSIPVGLYRNTPGRTGRFIMANPAIARMFGYATVDDFLQCSVAELYVEPADRKKFSDKLLAQGYVNQEVFRFRRTDGTRFWGALTSRAVRDEQGEIKYFDGMFEDITEQKEAQAALRDSEAQFRALFERSRDALMITNREGYIDVNQACLDLFGYAKKEEFLAKSRKDMSPPQQPDGEDSFTAAKRRVETAFREGSHFFEWLHQRRDGSTFIANVLLSKFELRGSEVLQANVRDITESKKIEDELRQEKEKAQQYLNIAGSIIVVISRDQTVSLLNRKGCEVLGYQSEEILGRNWFDFVVPEPERAGVKKVFDQLVGGVLEGAQDYENEIVTKKRDKRLIAWHNTLLRDRAGAIIGTMSSGEDITERKQWENALKDSEYELRAIFDSVTEGIGLMDEETGKMFKANRAYCRIVGYTPEEILEVGPMDFHFEEDLPAIQAHLMKQAAGEYTLVENVRMKKQDGTEVYADITAKRVELKGRKYLIGVIRDITDRRQAQAALQESEERYRALIENLPVGLFRSTADPEGRFIMANPAMVRMFGYNTPAELFQQPVLSIYQDPQGRENFSRKLLDRGHVLSEELQLQRRDGSIIWGSVTAQALRDETGEIKVFDGVIEDITERKRAEAALHEEKLFTEQSLDILQDLFYVFSREGKFLRWNRRLSEVSGYSAAEIAQMRPLDFFFEEDKPRVMAAIQTVFEEGSSRVEAPVRTKSGARIAHEFSGTLFKDSQGNLLLCGSARDITERKRAEEALKESERRLADIINFLPVATLVIDREGRVTAWNQALEILTGTKAEAVLGQGDHEYALPFYGERRDILIDLVYAPREELETRYREVRQHDGYLSAEAFVPKLGRDLVGFAGVLRDSQGRAVGAIESILDVTERKRAEEGLKESERRLAEIIDFLPVATFVTDNEGRVTAWNRAIEHLLGVKASDMLGKGDHEYAIPFYGERRPILIDLVDTPLSELQEKYQHIELNEGILRAEAVIPAVGEGRIMVGDATGLFDSRGNKVGAIECARDITDFRRNEAELTEAKDAAEAANRAKSAFLAMMSHEIRTPMNAIIGMAEILADTELSDDQRSYTEIVMSAAGSLLNIINDILDFSKIEAGKMDLAPKPFDFRKLVEELGQLFALKVDQKKIDLVINYEPGTPKDLIGDELRLRQILTNLVGNAAKFTQAGHILIDVSAKSRDEKNATLLVQVQDTGAGIPEAAQATIFDTFTQADSSSRRRFEGTGLGLAITRQLVQLMGGEVGFVSELGKGSTFYFTITLPRSAEVKEEAKLSVNLAGLRALVVDDNKVNRMVIRKQLASWDMAVTETADPVEALAMIKAAAEKREPYDLAILDYQMPRMDGIQLAEAIRADAALNDTVLIMLFSAMQQSNLEHLERLGLAACLTKPVRTMQLMETISAVWSARRQGQKLKMITYYGPSLEYLRPGASSQAPQYLARVLLAEDNLANQKVAVRILETLGATVEVASDGNEAVKMAAGGDFDLIFMDCQMPDLDGFEAAQKIRELTAGGRRVPIIALTAYAMPGDRERCLQAGMDDYITKPISKHRLAEMLGKYGRAPAGRAPQRTEKLLLADADEKAQLTVYQSLRKIFPGAKIKTCADGIRMVSLLGSFAPDLLVFDLALPNISHPALLRYLREDERLSKTKVLALANLEKNDPRVLREILALGLEGLIYKPLQVDKLEETIARFLKLEPPAPEAAAATVPPPAAPPAEPAPRPGVDETLPIVDYGVLDNVTGGDAELAKEIVAFYRESLPKDLEQVRAAIATEEMKAIERTGHSVKGAAANVGAVRLSKLAGRIELAAREGKLDECKQMAQTLPGLLAELMEELSKFGAA